MRTSKQTGTASSKKSKRGATTPAKSKTSWRANRVSKLKIENAVTDLCNAVASARSKGAIYPQEIDAALNDLTERADEFYWSAMCGRFGNEPRV